MTENMFVGFDIEVFLKDWLIKFKLHEQDKFYTVWNDNDYAKRIVKSLIDHDCIFYGYNIKHYDNYVLNAILNGASPDKVKELNDWIIAGNNAWEHPLCAYKRIPYVYTDLRDDVVDKGLSLKAIEGNLNLPIIESSIPFNINRALTDEEREEVEFYCEHDVYSTEKLLDERIGYVNNKISLANMFNRPIGECLKKTSAGMCGYLLDAKSFKQDKKLTFEMPLNIKAEYIPDDVLKNFEKINTTPDDKLQKECSLEALIMNGNFGDCIVKFGLGGGHGAIPCCHFETKDGYKLLWYDVESLYPMTMILFHVFSRAVANDEGYKDIVFTRLKAKHGEDISDFLNQLSNVEITAKAVAGDLKLIINATYGGMGQKTNVMCDLENRLNVCVIGQLATCELMMKMWDTMNFDGAVVNYNTDGILLYVNEKQEKELDAIVKEWEKRTGFKMEKDEVREIWQKDVNNYIAILENGKVEGKLKVKGGYVNQYEGGSFKMNTNRASQIALVEYFTKKAKVEDTILNIEDIHDFQFITKTGNTFSKTVFVYKDGTREEVQKVNRLYAVYEHDKNSGILYKVKKDEKGEHLYKMPDISHSSAVDNKNILTIDEIDKEFYINKAKDMIRDFEVADKTTMKKLETLDILSI